jgi:3-deoxy-manno-octulosonate cytidylyltransferase (CMP-KDO synthetase)
MKEGDVILVPLPQSDGQRKPRPAVVLRILPPFGDLLVCGISTKTHQQVAGLDEIITTTDPDFASSGLRAPSIIRLGFLAEFLPRQTLGVIGKISIERHHRLLVRLSQFLASHPAKLQKILGIIPARYASTRFPGKPLAQIAGKPLIQHVVEQCKKAASLSEIIVATDDARIAETAKQFCRVEMTRADHPSGSDRIAEVATRCECDGVVNIQGDEPLMDPAVIDAVAGALNREEMSTAAAPITDAAEYENPNVVKVVVNASGRALYFSRRTIPFLREAASGSVSEQLAAFPFLKHLGIYGYRRETLLRLVKFPVSPLENAEKLEQLRALENGIQIAVVKVNYNSIGVDAPEDVERVENMLTTDGHG